MAIIVVNLFKPASIPFWLEKSWEDPPIEAKPSPFGECNKIKTINKVAVIICKY